ncbi:MAG: efflux RND transporter permease subunit [Prolixibacteraceae bacterium]|nr:efflux RND transporter permease subunit [Prolixibacteraceae bacterium]
MVKFLLNKPIAVTMTFIAIMIVGMVAVTKIPVSLMPDIAIPEITVQVSSENTSARELENSVVNPLRQQLMQVAHLDDINSETTDGSSIIRLQFSYGANIDYAFIEVNEKIDRAMGYLPRDIQRPKVIKANVSDVPVFYLNLTLKKNESSYNPEETSHSKTSEASLKREASNVKQSGTSNANEVSFKREASNVKRSGTSNANEVSFKREASNVKRSGTSNANKVSFNRETSNLFPVSSEFVDMSRFASNVIRKRLEQLPEVAMVDMSGLAKTEILIIPDEEKLDALHISLANLENLIGGNNIQLGNLSIKDGQYIYNVRFESTLKNKQDIENIYFNIDNRLLQLKDIATVIEHPQNLTGKVISNNGETITMAVIKQSDAQMKQLKKSLHGLVGYFETDYPEIQFEIVRDQTKLLDYSINNLKQSLLWGALLAFFVMFLFLRDTRSPLLIGITIPVSLVLSLLFFHLIGISVNIISLSGLILGVGMMVDNSIIVIDNISQHYERNRLKSLNGLKSSNSNASNPSNANEVSFKRKASNISEAKNQIQRIKLLFSACVSGTNEVIRPMLSSVLTTCAVFIPLIFIKGITGALFYDQAMAVTIGLFASLAVSITILPVYYLVFFRKGRKTKIDVWMQKVNSINYEELYEKGFRFTLRHQKTAWGIVLVMLIISAVLYKTIPQSKLPVMEKDELMVHIDWNDRINIEESENKLNEVIRGLGEYYENYTGLIGEQQFLMNKSETSGEAEAVIYLKLRSPDCIEKVKQKTVQLLQGISSNSSCTFNDADNIFNVIFPEQEEPLVARLRATDDFQKLYKVYLKETKKTLEDSLKISLAPIVWQEQTLLRASPEKLLLYGVSYNVLYNKLKTLFNQNQIALLTDNADFVPVVLGGSSRNLEQIIGETSVKNSNGEQIPIRQLFSQHADYELKTILAGKEGEYYAINLPVKNKKPEGLINGIRKILRDDNRFEASFSGSYFSNREMIKQLVIILLISLSLLYFILAAQFESLLLPIIVLFEVPIDIFGALLLLWLFGSGINLMSLIGIVVMSGIIINDSILKIDTVNQLRKQGYSLIRALSVAGKRRLKPILMTSITTILALLPFLFVKGTGSDLQRPLALAIIGGMTVGTLVSLYFVPLGYYYLEKINRNRKEK